MHRRPALLAALGGCAHLQHEERGRVTVTPAGTSLGLAPRPADCTVEFLRTTTKAHRFVLAPEVSGFVEEGEFELPAPPPGPDAAAPASQVPGAGAVER